VKFVYPIENKSAEELYKLNREGFGGYFPIGLNNCYHGGIHLDGKHPIVAIADGTVIAYRYRKKYIEQENSGKTYRYTNGFVLIRQEYTSPKGQKLVFFSLYNHLCPWEEFSEEQKKRLPALFTKPGFKVTAGSLNVRSSMDSSRDGNIIAASRLSKGDEVVAKPVDERWAKKEGVEEYFVYKGYAEPIEIIREPMFDEIVAADIPIRAGMLVGYTGLLEFRGIPEGQTTCHIEVFAGDDAVPFIQNAKKDGEKRPTMLQIKAGAIVRSREKRYPNPAALVKATLKADTTVTVIEQNTDSEWMCVREKELIRSVKREWLEYHNDKTVKGDEHYTPEKEHLADVSKAFDGLELTVTSKLKLVARDGETDRKVKYSVPAEEAERYWVKKSLLGEIKGDTAVTSKDIPECFRQNPDALSFQKEVGKTTEDLLIKIDGIETSKDEEKRHWYHIKTPTVDGWICENDTENLKKLSAFDWPGFRIAKEAGDTAYDPIIDFKNLSPFFKRIVDEINTDSDKSVISREELKKAMKDESIAYKLSRLICFHQSEWWVDSEMKYWESVFKMIGPKQAELQKEVFRNTCWWDEVSRKFKDFLPTPNVYHWHPVAFVENMREMNWEPEWLVIARGEIGQKEIKGGNHNPRIVEYHSTTILKATDDEVAWCSSFVNWCFKQAGYVGTNSARAKDWVGWGKLYKKPIYGAVAIVDYGKDQNGKDLGGHVGFIVGKDLKNRLIILGGNQGEPGEGAVKYSAFRTTKIIAYTLPADYDFIEYELPLFNQDMEEGTFENTR